MSPEEERRFVTREIRVVIAFVVIILVIWAFVPTCRADSTVTNQQIADSLPKLREKWIATLEDSIRDRRTAQIDLILSHMRFDSGRIIFTCPVEIRFDSFPPNFSYGLSINIKELQAGNVVVWSSAIPTVRARGLDSVYVLPHDSLVAGSGLVTSHTIQIHGHWEYFNWLNGKRVNMRRVK